MHEKGTFQENVCSKKRFALILILIVIKNHVGLLQGIQSDVCIGIGNSEYFMPPAKFELDDSENALGKQFRPINFIEVIIKIT